MLEWKGGFKKDFLVCFYLKPETDLSMFVLLKEKSQQRVRVEQMRGMRLKARFLRQWEGMEPITGQAVFEVARRL